MRILGTKYDPNFDPILQNQLHIPNKLCFQNTLLPVEMANSTHIKHYLKSASKMAQKFAKFICFDFFATSRTPYRQTWFIHNNSKSFKTKKSRESVIKLLDIISSQSSNELKVEFLDKLTEFKSDFQKIPRHLRYRKELASQISTMLSNKILTNRW